jgi:tyrosine-protein phosphatase non-receptor type 9
LQASRDSNGAAIALFTVRLHFPENTSHQDVLKALVFQLDIALRRYKPVCFHNSLLLLPIAFSACSVETQRNGLVFIYDMTHSKYTNFDYELSIKILSMLKVSLTTTHSVFYSFCFFATGQLPCAAEESPYCYCSSLVQGTF